jgi:hypothetical protein
MTICRVGRQELPRRTPDDLKATYPDAPWTCRTGTARVVHVWQLLLLIIFVGLAAPAAWAAGPRHNTPQVYMSELTTDQKAPPKCIDVPGERPGSGVRPILYTCHGGVNQQIIRTNNDQLRVMGYCLSVWQGNTKNGAAVRLYQCQDVPDQRWTFTSNGEIRTRLKRQKPGCLDVQDAKTTNGAVFIIWDCWGGRNQQWRITTP